MKAVPISDLRRLLADSNESTLTAEDELSFIRICLRLMADGLPYEEALQSTYGQLERSINNGE